MAVVLFKVLVALVTGLLGWLVCRSRSLEGLSDRAFLQRVVGLQLALGLGLFIAVYILGRQEVMSDVPAFYLPEARAVLAGKVPFRDFGLSYAPLFPYIGAALVSLWNSGKVFALFAILVSALSLALWHSAANACCGSRVARQTSLLYATSGHMIIQTFLGTNQVWVAAALAGSCVLLARGRPISSGLVQSVALCTTKLLVLLFWPALWIFAAQRIRWLAGGLLLSLGVYGIFAALGADPSDPLREEGALISSGNLPYLLDPLLHATGLFGRSIFDMLALAALAAVTVWLYFRTQALSPQERPKLLLAGLALTGLVFMLVSKKSFTGYAAFFMYPAILALVLGLRNARLRMVFLLAFNALLVAEPSLWFRLGGANVTLGAWLEASGGLVIAGFIAVDVALLACYMYLAWISARCVQQAAANPEESRPLLHTRPMAQ